MTEEKKEPELQKIPLEPLISDIREQLAVLEKRIKALEDRWNEAVEKGEIHLH